MDTNTYIQGKKVALAEGNIKHVMAITLDPRPEYKQGIIRCVVSREGSLGVRGYIDRSELHHVHAKEDGTFDIGERLEIKDQEEIIKDLVGIDGDFIGLEDPDIWTDKGNNLTHLYFTIPIRVGGEEGRTKIHLGHAVGKDIHSLEMTEPVLLSNEKFSAKEVSIAPLNPQGFRYNLVESRDERDGVKYSTVQVAIANDMGKPWKYGEIAFHPAEHDISWAGEHASPGPLFPRSFIDVGEGKLLGIMNGREKSEVVDGETVYKTFSIGLFIYDYENGKIDWVSPERLIVDSEAKIITFASQFVETAPGEGVLYAHVDDSFVRAYELNAEGIRKLLPIDF